VWAPGQHGAAAAGDGTYGGLHARVCMELACLRRPWLRVEEAHLEKVASIPLRIRVIQMRAAARAWLRGRCVAATTSTSPLTSVDTVASASTWTPGRRSGFAGAHEAATPFPGVAWRAIAAVLNDRAVKAGMGPGRLTTRAGSPERPTPTTTTTTRGLATARRDWDELPQGRSARDMRATRLPHVHRRPTPRTPEERRANRTPPRVRAPFALHPPALSTPCQGGVAVCGSRPSARAREGV